MAALGEEVVFTCFGFGIPLPNLTWTHNDSNSPLAPPKYIEVSYTITNNQGRISAASKLRILNSSFSEGSYKCTGSNGVLNLIQAQNFVIGTFLLEGTCIP